MIAGNVRDGATIRIDVAADELTVAIDEFEPEVAVA
jgi:hypothetical protein